MTAVARDIFKRLSAGRPPAESETKQPRRREDPKIFLKDILANGPAPTTLVSNEAGADLPENKSGTPEKK